MILIPAIDLIDQQCVRLTKGKYEDQKVYSKDPVEVARMIEDSGAEYLHIIDLDHAMGKGENTEVIEKIRKAVSLPIQVGGGVRDEAFLKRLVDLGISRVILGTKAIQDESFAVLMAEKYGDKVCVSVDCVGEDLKISGWTKGISKNVFSYLEKIKEIQTVIYTDISRDGMLTGPNIEMLAKIRAVYNGTLIAAGGMQGVEDFDALQKIRIDGAVVGKAWYENKITLEQMKQWRDNENTSSMFGYYR